jgi:hypothetical protein
LLPSEGLPGADASPASGGTGLAREYRAVKYIVKMRSSAAKPAPKVEGLIESDSETAM